MAPVIEVTGLTKRFRIPERRRDTLREHFFQAFRPVPHRELLALDNVTLRIERGETLAIMGRNGSGKSTLLKTLCGVYAPDAGAVTVRAPLTPLLELGIGWDFELDAIDNILLISTCMGLSLKNAHAAVDDILTFAGVEAFANLPLKHYSSGMAQRLAYATAFANVHDILVIDEVSAVGDVGFKAKCHERFRALHQSGHTLVVVSHEPGFVRNFCSRGILLDGGRILQEGPANDIVDAYLKVGANDAPPEKHTALSQPTLPVSSPG